MEVTLKFDGDDFDKRFSTLVVREMFGDMHKMRITEIRRSYSSLVIELTDESEFSDSGDSV